MQRRLVHPSGKYWEIERGARGLRVRWGVLGGASQQREMPGDDAKLEEQAAKQRALGYVDAVTAESIVASLDASTPWYRRLEGAGQFLALRGEKSHLRVAQGAIGTDGTGGVLKLGSFRNVVEHARMLIGPALDASMVLVAEVEPAPPEPALSSGPALAANPELEAQCLAAPDDPAPWAVYTDWLMTQNDPRGEIAALRVRGEVAAAEAKFAEVKVVLFGNETSNENKYGEYDTSNAELLDAVTIVAWRHGFPQTIEIRRAGQDSDLQLDVATKRFLKLPTAVFVDTIKFGLASFLGDNNWKPTIDAVGKSPVATRIRSLRFDAYDDEAQELSSAPFGDFSRAWARLPGLEALTIASGKGGVLGTINLPSLKTFVRICSGLAKNEIASIANAAWPALEHLEIWFGDADHGAHGTAPMLAPIFAGTKLPQLRHLGLVHCDFVGDALAALATSRLLPRLRTLDLSYGVFGEREAAFVVAHADRFAHLEAIEITNSVFTEAQLRELRAAVKLVTERPRGSEDMYRYTNAGE